MCQWLHSRPTNGYFLCDRASVRVKLKCLLKYSKLQICSLCQPALNLAEKLVWSQKLSREFFLPKLPRENVGLMWNNCVDLLLVACMLLLNQIGEGDALLGGGECQIKTSPFCNSPESQWWFVMRPGVIGHSNYCFWSCPDITKGFLYKGIWKRSWRFQSISINW